MLDDLCQFGLTRVVRDLGLIDVDATMSSVHTAFTRPWAPRFCAVPSGCGMTREIRAASISWPRDAAGTSTHTW